MMTYASFPLKMSAAHAAAHSIYMGAWPLRGALQNKKGAWGELYFVKKVMKVPNVTKYPFM